MEATESVERSALTLNEVLLWLCRAVAFSALSPVAVSVALVAESALLTWLSPVFSSHTECINFSEHDDLYFDEKT